MRYSESIKGYCSSCCNEGVYVASDETNYYVCGSCKNPCDTMEMKYGRRPVSQCCGQYPVFRPSLKDFFCTACAKSCSLTTA